MSILGKTQFSISELPEKLQPFARTWVDNLKVPRTTKKDGKKGDDLVSTDEILNMWIKGRDAGLLKPEQGYSRETMGDLYKEVIIMEQSNRTIFGKMADGAMAALGALALIWNQIIESNN